MCKFFKNSIQVFRQRLIQNLYFFEDKHTHTHTHTIQKALDSARVSVMKELNGNKIVIFQLKLIGVPIIILQSNILLMVFENKKN